MCMYIWCVHACVCAHACMCAHVYMHVCVCVHADACMCAYALCSVCMHECICMHFCEHACGRHRLMSKIFHDGSFTLLFAARSFIQTQWAIWLVSLHTFSRDSLSPHSKARIIREPPHTFEIYMGSANVNSSILAWTTSALTFGSSPQSKELDFVGWKDHYKIHKLVQ